MPPSAETVNRLLFAAAPQTSALVVISNGSSYGAAPASLTRPVIEPVSAATSGPYFESSSSSPYAATSPHPATSAAASRIEIVGFILCW